MPPAATPVYAHIAFLRIAQFASRSVSEQASLKEQLEGRARSAIASLPIHERAVLDAEDGLAIVLFGEPAQALEVIQAIHAASRGAPIQAGLNHGPLAITSHGPDARVFGDGLTAAAAAARFATTAKLLVTQNFAKILQQRNPGRAAELANAGEFTDTRVRLHSFYTPDPKRGALHRRRMLAYGVGGVAAILVLGVTGRDAYQRLFPPLPAMIKFTVKPRGEIYVDGASRGSTPPLHEIQVTAGRRFVQVRNKGFPTLEITLDLKPGERTTIAHTFSRPAAPKQDTWRDFKKKLGGS